MKFKQHQVFSGRVFFQQLVMLGLLSLFSLFSQSSVAGKLVQVEKGSVGSSDLTQSYLGKKIAGIQLQGLKRIEKEAVLAKLRTQVGEQVSKALVRQDLQVLFKMGYFDDISVLGNFTPNGDVELIYVFKERPVISQVKFEGNERISSSDLKEVVKLSDWSILDLNKVKADVALIQKHYEEKGYYLARVSYELKTIKPDEVELIYRVLDSEKIQIKKITFLNNKRFSDDQLKSVFAETKEGGLFSFVSGSGSFKESSFKQDLQILTYWYLEHGYVRFRYENPVITVSDDKKWLYISIYVDEGEPYQVGSVDFSGDLLFSHDELLGGLGLKSGEQFSISKRNADIMYLSEKYQDQGYAFANVVPKMSLHDDTKTIDLDYSFEKGNLVSIGEINIVGNTKTFDHVIRRELKIHEGALYSGTNLRLSREAVERLGYFAPGEVLFNTRPSRTQSDVVNLEISVKERSTGTISIGAGFGNVQGPFFTGQIGDINFFGRGQSLAASAQYSTNRLQQSLNIQFNDPYAFDTLWGAGFDLFYMRNPIPNAYTLNKFGFGFRFAYPIFDYTNLALSYKIERLKVETTQLIGGQINPNLGLGLPGGYLPSLDEGILSSATLSLVRDQRNNRFETTGGVYQSAIVEFAGLGGDMQFVKAILNHRFYTRVIGDLVFRNNFEVGNIWGFGSRPIPPGQKFYLGGPSNMRGYNFFSLGPLYPIRDPNFAAAPRGGTFEAFTSVEFEYPLLKEAGMKAVVFFDAGNAWDGIPSAGAQPIQTDVGFGIRYFSPMGPWRFEWGYPLNPRRGDDTMVFNFFIGSPF